MPTYPTLVRDRIPELIHRHGGTPRTRQLDDADFADALARKLVEEAEEFAAAGSIDELADVLEVVRALASVWAARWRMLTSSGRPRSTSEARSISDCSWSRFSIPTLMGTPRDIA